MLLREGSCKVHESAFQKLVRRACVPHEHSLPKQSMHETFFENCLGIAVTGLTGPMKFFLFFAVSVSTLPQGKCSCKTALPTEEFRG